MTPSYREPAQDAYVSRIAVAIQEGNDELVAHCLAEKLALDNRPPNRLDDLLCMACEHGNTQIVDLLLGAGGNPQAFNQHGQCALGMAANAGDERCVELLLEKGAKSHPFDNDKIGEDCATPLTMATMAGYDRIIGLLLDHGAQDNPCFGESWALLWACRVGCMKGVEMLWDYQPALDPQQHQMLVDAAMKDGHHTIAGWLDAKRDHRVLTSTTQAYGQAQGRRL